MTSTSAQASFRAEYAAHRASEGRELDTAAMLSLPYLRQGPVARQWAVRARSYETLMSRIVAPLAKALGRSLHVADLGAGNGWLSWRLAQVGHSAIAVDIRDDAVDGLGAAHPFLRENGERMQRCVASFEHLPLCEGCCDLVVFNASLHYAVELPSVLDGARRALRDGGRIAIVDSPFYERAGDGELMVEEKRRTAHARFGSRAAALMALTFVEYLTRDRLASAAPKVQWTRHRVRYPLWYELRPFMARVQGRRMPSRFDVWEGALT